ncbi:MAG TPA: ankyrin repeat domain-containing protein [Caulobacterales bacterium]|nr:ankyrin repeat domain-containing protein [Caulobacterales bacterium]
MRVRWVGGVCAAVCILFATLAGAAERDLRLIEASKRGDAPAVKALVSAGVDVNARAGDGGTALHWASNQDSIAIVDMLLRKGANVNAATDLGITPLWIAANNSSAPMIARLLEAGADPNIAPPTEGSPLMVAARRGNAEAAKALLARGADPNMRETSRGQTALMWAVSERHPEVVRLLLAAHADVKARSNSSMQRVVLCCQLYEGDEEGDATIPEGGFTPLFFAAQDGDVETVKLLVAAGADVNDSAPDGASPLVVAAHAGQSAIVAALLEAGADPNAAGAGYTALHVAALRGDVAMARALLEHGANPNARQQKGSPTKRVRSGHALDHRLVGATPFILAVRACQYDVMRLLAAKGADPSLTVDDGRNALMVLAGPGTQEEPILPESRAAEAAKLAVQLGTPPSQASATGDTALHVAATRRRDLLVQALVDSGAAINARNRKGQTPLTAALTPPPPQKGTGLTEEYEALKSTSTAALLRKLGAKT